MATYLQIKFDDFEQGFEEWTFDLASGEIVDCQPLQQDIWIGCVVELKTVGVADCPRFANSAAEADKGNWIALRYPVVQITVVDWQPYEAEVQP
jgi:hypothetical protein